MYLLPILNEYATEKGVLGKNVREEKKNGTNFCKENLYSYYLFSLSVS